MADFFLFNETPVPRYYFAERGGRVHRARRVFSERSYLLYPPARIRRSRGEQSSANSSFGLNYRRRNNKILARFCLRRRKNEGLPHGSAAALAAFASKRAEHGCILASWRPLSYAMRIKKSATEIAKNAHFCNSTVQ